MSELERSDPCGCRYQDDAAVDGLTTGPAWRRIGTCGQHSEGLVVQWGDVTDADDREDGRTAYRATIVRGVTWYPCDHLVHTLRAGTDEVLGATWDADLSDREGPVVDGSGYGRMTLADAMAAAERHLLGQPNVGVPPMVASYVAPGFSGRMAGMPGTFTLSPLDT